MLSRLALVGKSKKHACRVLHSLVEGTGVTLKLQFEPVLITLRRLKPVRVCQAWWPTFSMQAWASHLLEHHPKILLAGHSLQDRGWQRIFRRFWKTYRTIDPTHPVFQSGYDTSFLAPYAFHGDEGRGRGKVPFLVFSWQPVVSHLGLGHCNDSTCLNLSWPS